MTQLYERNDLSTQRLVWHLINNTKGGLNRIRIIELLHARPSNTNQIACKLNIDYKTALHHIEVLTRNELVITDSKAYGATYFLTPLMEKNFDEAMRLPK